MTTDSDRVRLPELPSVSGKGPNAQRARAPAREESTLGPGYAERAKAMFRGASLWHAAPLSLSAIWDHHVASATYYDKVAIRYPRYAWGILHIALALTLYALAWATDSFPKFVLVAGSLTMAVWLL